MLIEWVAAASSHKFAQCICTVLHCRCMQCRQLQTRGEVCGLISLSENVMPSNFLNYSLVLCLLLKYFVTHTHTHTHTRLTALCPGLPRWASTRKAKLIKRQWEAVATAGPDASQHLAPDSSSCRASTSPLSFLQAGCPSFHPTNSVKALKAFKALKVVTHLAKMYKCYQKH